MNKEITIQGKKLFYRVYGNGRPVLLLHGFGEDGSVWKDQVSFLQNDFRMIVPDLPGSGLSDITDDMSMEGMAETIKTLVEAEVDPFNRVALIGHSMGGYITLAFMEKYPEMIDRFGLFHSTAYADSEEKKEIRRKGIEFIENNGAAAFLQTATPNLFSQKTKNEHPELIDALLKDAGNFSREALISYYKAMINRPDRTMILKTIPIPILFIIGEEDMAIPVKDSLEQCHLPSISHIHILKNCGHMGMWEHPAVCNKMISGFISF